MFDVRKIQEQAIYSAIKEAGGEGMAKEIVYGEHGQYSLEDNATWVKSTMSRLESRFGKPLLRQIRRNCQCGYGMDEKLALVQELVASSSCLEEFASQDKARAAVCIAKEENLICNLHFVLAPCWRVWVKWIQIHGACAQQGTARRFLRKRLAARWKLNCYKVLKWAAIHVSRKSFLSAPSGNRRINDSFGISQKRLVSGRFYA